MRCRSLGREDTVYVGIDNGLSGGVALVTAEGVIAKTPMFVTERKKGNELDVLEVWHWIRRETTVFKRMVVVIEEPGGSKSYRAAVSMAASFHALRAMCVLNGVTWRRITPGTWQKPLLAAATGDTKPAALRLARKLWPEEDWRRTPRSTTAHDGMVDAALIGEFSRRSNL